MNTSDIKSDVHKVNGMEENKPVLNTVVASPRVAGEGLGCAGFSEYWYPDEFIDFLLSESATMIYLPYAEISPFEYAIDKLSKIAKNHVTIIDKKQKVFNEIKEIIISISEEMDYTEKNERDIDYALDRLLQFLYHMKLAKEYESEADVSRIDRFIDDIGFILDNTTNNNIKTFVSEVLGVFNIYSERTIEGDVFKTDLSPDILNERFKQIMLDSRFLDLSSTRYQLNKHRDLNLIPRINVIARKISTSKEYKKIMKPIKIGIYLITSPIRNKYNYDVINSFLTGSYVPSLIDLDNITQKVVYKRITGKEYDPERIIKEDEEFYVAPWSVYDLPGESVFRQE